MRTYVGIDLGTTNSAICTFDGKETNVRKSPDQSDVTPSAIYIDRRGHRMYGRRAVTLASTEGENAALLFKRYLGTTKEFRFRDAGVTMTPVECSAELLRVLYGYLPEEVRNDPETVTVITVPSAFNQMKKDATLEAARSAGIGKTALMQEPVAAVMSVLKKEPAEKLFLIYDLGGGTFDISVARHVGGHVSLLAQGGREMCGGRDMDRWIYRRLVLPWLRKNFALPEDPDLEPAYLKMKQELLLAVEEAKIALSGAAGDQGAELWVDEKDVDTKDLKGNGIFLDMRLTRNDIEELIGEMAEQTVKLTQETMAQAGVSAQDISQIIFIGGPTMYAPLRDKVCDMLGIPMGTAVNPMTAVAEGASIYAEMIDWENDLHRRKKEVGEIREQDERRVSIRYEKRTSLAEGSIAVILPAGKKAQARVCSLDAESAYDSGMVPVSGRGILKVPLPENGLYRFRLQVFGGEEEAPAAEEILEITRIFAAVSSIPASYSIAVKALDRLGGKPVPVYLVQANEPLPKVGTVAFRAAQQLMSGGSGAITFSLWEGEIEDPIEDNRYIGEYRIPGTVIPAGIVQVGAEILCDYEVNEAGNLRLGVSIPCVGLQVEDRNFYCRDNTGVGAVDAMQMRERIHSLLDRTMQIKQGVVDAELEEVRKTLMELQEGVSHAVDSEYLIEAQSRLNDCCRRIARFQLRYKNVIRSRKLQDLQDRFRFCEPTAAERDSFENLSELARYSVDMGSDDFDAQLEEMRRILAVVLWRSDSWVTDLFRRCCADRKNVKEEDAVAYDRLVAEGRTCLENGQIAPLREIANRMLKLRDSSHEELDPSRMFGDVNIYRA